MWLVLLSHLAEQLISPCTKSKAWKTLFCCVGDEVDDKDNAPLAGDVDDDDDPENRYVKQHSVEHLRLPLFA